ncbi:MAG: type II secretion system protein [Candidatus Shapirobacteria bacterium]|nr:type II secretion system protein [Candidatus Shapirobacteria bacterium]
MKKRNLGFTLFELLVSISIIGILTAIATVSYSSAQKKARDARRMEDMGNIQKAAEVYYSQHSYTYPTKAQFTEAGGVLLAWPKDPKTGDDYVYQLGTTYCVCVGLDNATGNSTSPVCASFVTGTGTSQCVTSQQ